MSEAKQRDPELEQYFDSMKKLLDFPEFRLFVTELEAQAVNINAVENVVPSEIFTLGEEAAFRKGQMNVIRTVQNLRENIEICEGEYHDSLEPNNDLLGLEDSTLDYSEDM